MTSEMVDAFQNMIRSLTESAHVAFPGTILGYEPVSGLCQVRPVGTMKKPDGTSMEYPIIAGVPICSPAGIAIPVRTGAACLIIICDADISGWLSGKTAVQSMPHSLQNAVCIPELRKTPSAMQAYANANNCVAIEGSLYVSGGLTVAGSVNVSGSITSAGNCNAPNID